MRKISVPRPGTILKEITRILPKENPTVYLFRIVKGGFWSAVYQPKFGSLHIQSDPSRGVFSCRLAVQDMVAKSDGLVILFDMRSISLKRMVNEWKNPIAIGLMRASNAGFWLCEKHQCFPELVGGSKRIYFGVWKNNSAQIDPEYSEALLKLIQALHRQP